MYSSLKANLITSFKTTSLWFWFKKCTLLSHKIKKKIKVYLGFSWQISSSNSFPVYVFFSNQNLDSTLIFLWHRVLDKWSHLSDFVFPTFGRKQASSFAVKYIPRFISWKDLEHKFLKYSREPGGNKILQRPLLTKFIFLSSVPCCFLASRDGQNLFLVSRHSVYIDWLSISLDTKKVRCEETVLTWWCCFQLVFVVCGLLYFYV